MLRYIVKRLLWFVPTMFVISIVGFLLISKISIDPVGRLLAVTGDDFNMESVSSQKSRQILTEKYHFDLPLFYFSMDHLSSDGVNENQGIENHKTWDYYVPRLSYHGIENQYHYWLVGLLKGDLGRSLQDGRSVSASIWDRIFFTLGFSFLALLISYIIALYLGYIASIFGVRISKFISIVLFLIHSVPAFWLASLLISWVTNAGIDIPVFGVHEWSEELPFLDNVTSLAEHMYLPLICWSYSSIAFIYFQFNTSIDKELGSDYVRTAFSKGLGKKEVIKSHVIKNALIPLITIMAEILPSLVGGSIIIEVIFSIPGMGKYMYDAILFQDYPVVLAVLVMSSLLLLLSYLIADILYTWADPRIKSQFSRNGGQ